MWAHVAPILAKSHTVVCPDLRGYGDSSKPRGLPDHSNYSFRTMAADQVRVMDSLGFKRFHVAGHDRGGRVSHRMALDWPDRIASLNMLDIVPTLTMYGEADLKFGKVFWLWFFLPAPEPLPETMIGADPDFFFDALLGKYGTVSIDAFDPAVLADYRRCWRDPATIHAICADYRAGISIDLEHDKADLNRKVECPTQVIWAADGLMGNFYDFPKIWRERCSNMVTATVPGGHFFADLYPKETAAVLERFIGTVSL
jgi:haloacetate dehalogenase